jgi:UDP-glucose 4-epimerase
MTKLILLCGGCGYIGSHTLLELLSDNNFTIHILDNLSNSSVKVLRRIEILASLPNNCLDAVFHQFDLQDSSKLEELFNRFRFDIVIHFAGLKSVSESVQSPLMYYRNNLISTIVLLETMDKFNCRNIIFSSSATVYGIPNTVPINENAPVQGIQNPYGRTKAMIEDIMKDLTVANKKWKIVLLRYFNPAGAHPSGLIGEDPKGIPNNLFPYITQVAVGKRPFLNIFGNTYDTIDGTGIRDYIHIVDLAKGHVAAVKFFSHEWSGTKIYNLGRGVGCSVLQLVSAFEKYTNIKIPYKMDVKRDGDIAICYCDPSNAEKDLDWSATLDIKNMCVDGWKWQSNNPNGFL